MVKYLSVNVIAQYKYTSVFISLCNGIASNSYFVLNYYNSLNIV